MHGLQFSLRFKADAMVEKMQSVMILAIFVNNVKFLLCLFGIPDTSSRFYILNVIGQ